MFLQVDTFLKQNVIEELLNFFVTEKGATSNFDTKSIAYVDVQERLCTVMRILSTSKRERNTTFYRLSSTEIPLQEALKIDASRDSFTLLHRRNEDKKRSDFLAELYEQKELSDFERYQEYERFKAENERIQKERANRRKIKMEERSHRDRKSVV